MSNVTEARHAPSAAASDTATVTRRPPTLIAARFALPFILVALVILFSLLRPETFATASNFKTILTQNSVLAVLAIGAMLPLVAGQFDLSVGAVLGAGLILVTGLTSKSGLPMGVALVIAIAGCLVVGIVNGFLVAMVGINAFVATLATGTLLGGLELWYTNGNVIEQGIPTSLTDLGQSHLAGIQLPIIYALVIAVLAGYVLRMTPVGRYLYAVGGSREAARLSGLNVKRLTLSTFVFSSLLAGVAGITLAAQLGSGNPTSGPPYLLPAFAACFLGSTAIRPGTFNVTGTVCAVLTIATGTTGLELLGVPFYIEPIFSGAVLILAAVATRYLQREQT
jgi:ribose transport system permease protein